MNPHKSMVMCRPSHPPPKHTHPSCLQFVKRMGVRTHKSMVMCRPSQIEVAVEPPPSLRGNPSQGQPYSPATVLERKDVGDVMKYWVKFDDGQVGQSPYPFATSPPLMVNCSSRLLRIA